jgi:hypothetical protein
MLRLQFLDPWIWLGVIVVAPEPVGGEWSENDEGVDDVLVAQSRCRDYVNAAVVVVVAVGVVDTHAKP